MHKLTYKKFLLNVRKSLFTGRMTGHWKKLPRKDVWVSFLGDTKSPNGCSPEDWAQPSPALRMSSATPVFYGSQVSIYALQILIYQTSVALILGMASVPSELSRKCISSLSFHWDTQAEFTTLLPSPFFLFLTSTLQMLSNEHVPHSKKRQELITLHSESYF